MLEALQWYNSLLWIRYPFARCARRRVSVSSSGIVPSWRHSEIGLHESASGLGGPIMATISSPGSWVCPTGLIEAPKSTFKARAAVSSPDGAPGPGIGLSLPGEVPGSGVRTSSSRRNEGLNKSCANTPGGGGSWLNLS
jgi:hypothetical protein